MPIRKGGQRHAEQRNGHEGLAHEGATAQGGVDAHRDADEERQHGRDEGQLQRGRKAFADQARHLGALAQAQAELALRRIDEEVPELHEEGPVEPQGGAHFTDLLGLGILTQQEHDGVADVLEQEEGNERDRDHHDHGLDQAAQYKGNH
jgi:hypothetical protein